MTAPESHPAEVTGLVEVDGAPARWARVQVRHGDGDVTDVRADADGRFTATGLPAGPVTVSAHDARRAHHLHEIPERAEPGIDPVEVRDVVAIVAVRRWIDRHEPQAGDAELSEVVDALRETVEVAGSVTAPIEVRLVVEAVDDRGLPPEIAGVGDLHGWLPCSCGSTLAPNVSMKSCCSWPTWWR